MSQEKVINIQVPEGYEVDTEKSTLTNIVFKPKEVQPEKSKYPMSHRECFEKGDVVYWGMSNGDIGERNLEDTYLDDLKSKELAEAFLALMQLKTICDKWNEIDGFIPDWTDGEQDKHCVVWYNNELEVEVAGYVRDTLPFESMQTARLFIQSFSELLTQAKPLL